MTIYHLINSKLASTKMVAYILLCKFFIVKMTRLINYFLSGNCQDRETLYFFIYNCNNC